MQIGIGQYKRSQWVIETARYCSDITLLSRFCLNVNIYNSSIGCIFYHFFSHACCWNQNACSLIILLLKCTIGYKAKTPLKWWFLQLQVKALNCIIIIYFVSLVWASKRDFPMDIENLFIFISYVTMWGRSNQRVQAKPVHGFKFTKQLCKFQTIFFQYFLSYVNTRYNKTGKGLIILKFEKHPKTIIFKIFVSTHLLLSLFQISEWET